MLNRRLSSVVNPVIPRVARNPGYLALLANRLVSGIPFDTIFDRRAGFTPLALHAYGDASFRMTGAQLIPIFRIAVLECGFLVYNLLKWFYPRRLIEFLK